MTPNMPEENAGVVPTLRFQPTKKRAVELVGLGLKVYEYMTEIGIKQEEYCHFGNVMQTLLRLPD